jgi:hypothetical protein
MRINLARSASPAPLRTMLPAGSVDLVSEPNSLPLLIHDAFAADNDDVFLQIIKILDALDHPVQVNGHLRHQNNVRLAVGGAQRDVARMAPHDLDDGDAAVALRRGADAFHARSGDKDGGGIAGRGVIDDLVQGKTARDSVRRYL